MNMRNGWFVHVFVAFCYMVVFKRQNCGYYLSQYGSIQNWVMEIQNQNLINAINVEMGRTNTLGGAKQKWDTQREWLKWSTQQNRRFYMSH